MIITTTRVITRNCLSVCFENMRHGTSVTWNCSFFSTASWGDAKNWQIISGSNLLRSWCWKMRPFVYMRSFVLCRRLLPIIIIILIAVAHRTWSIKLRKQIVINDGLIMVRFLRLEFLVGLIIILPSIPHTHKHLYTSVPKTSHNFNCFNLLLFLKKKRSVFYGILLQTDC